MEEDGQKIETLSDLLVASITINRCEELITGDRDLEVISNVAQKIWTPSERCKILLLRYIKSKIRKTQLSLKTPLFHNLTSAGILQNTFI